jgi:hypothetical protein
METRTLVTDGFQMYHFWFHRDNFWRKKDNVAGEEFKIIWNVSSNTRFLFRYYRYEKCWERFQVALFSMEVPKTVWVAIAVSKRQHLINWFTHNFTNRLHSYLDAWVLVISFLLFSDLYSWHKWILDIDCWKVCAFFLKTHF